jgi:alpha-glucuronidase
MSVANVWDGVEVKLTFRRTFSEEMMERWNELTEIISSVRFNEDSDTLVWQYESKGEYSTQSLYAVINFKGVVPIYIPAVWKLKVPPKVQVFL